MPERKELPDTLDPVADELADEFVLREHESANLDEALEETFPSSDPVSPYVASGAEVADLDAVDAATTESMARSEALDSIAHLVDAFRETAAELGGELRVTGDRIAVGARNIGEAISDEVRVRPLASMAIVFSAGYLLAKVLRR